MRYRRFLGTSAILSLRKRKKPPPKTGGTISHDIDDITVSYAALHDDNDLPQSQFLTRYSTQERSLIATMLLSSDLAYQSSSGAMWSRRGQKILYCKICELQSRLLLCSGPGGTYAQAREVKLARTFGFWYWYYVSVT